MAAGWFLTNTLYTGERSSQVMVTAIDTAILLGFLALVRDLRPMVADRACGL